MANTNKVSGLTPVDHMLGHDWDSRGHVYYVASTDTTRLSPGDPVKLTGTADTTGQYPGITRATAGATCVGVLLSIGVNPGAAYVDPANLDLVQAPATKLQAYYAFVCDDPFVIYEIQEAGAGANLVITDVGQNIDFVAADPAAGVRLSAFYADNNAHDTTSTRNLKLLGLVRRADNALGQYAKWRVLINNHSFKVGVTGI